MNVKWPSNEKIDEKLREIYAGAGTGTDTVAAFARRIGYPITALQYRAKSLGLTRMDYRFAWSDAEERIVRSNVHHSAHYVWQRLKEAGFKRTYIAVKRKIVNQRLKSETGFLTSGQVCAAFGISKQTLAKWIRMGWLKATVKDYADEPDPQHHYLVKESSIRDFVRQHPMAFDLRKVDQLWFLSLVFDGKLGATARNYDGPKN